MGKTVAAVVGVVALVAIAVAAPMIAVGVLGFAAGSVGAAVATALIATTLSVAVAVGMRALVGGTPAPRTPTRPPYPQGTAIVDGFGPKLSYPLERSMRAIREHWLKRLWLGWACQQGRFYIIELVGDCMAPSNTDHWAIADQKAEIRAGDLCRLGIRDYLEAGMPDAADGFVKRFDGVNHELGFVECSCTNPPRTIHTGLTNLRLAHRIVRTAPTLKEAERVLRKVRRGSQSKAAAVPRA
jgi:hypothetical protein